MIPKLEMLLALAKERHFGRAAQSIGITQPSLSAGIRQLEEQLGVKLVQRGSRFGGMTPEGQRTLEWARKIVGDSRKLRDEMRASHAGLSGHLRLAVVPTALTWAARLSAKFAQDHPNIGFTILSKTSADILEMLDNLDADAGITYLDNEPLGRVTAQPIYSEGYAFLCGAEHPLAQLGSVAWSDLNDIQLSLLTPDMQNRRIINSNLMNAGVKPKTIVESNSTIVLATQVLAGGSATVLPLEMAQFLAAGHPMKVIPMNGGLQPKVGVVALHQEPYTPVLQAFLRMIDTMVDPDLK